VDGGFKCIFAVFFSSEISGVKMSDKETVIEVITSDEELPTDVRKRVFRISSFTEEDKNRILSLMNKIDALLSKADDTQMINNIIELKGKLTQIMLYVSRLEEKIDALPVGKESQKIDYMKDELKDYMAVLSDEIQASKRSFLSKLEELKQSFSGIPLEDQINEINTSLSAIKSVIRDNIKDDIKDSVSDIEYDIKTTVSDMGEDIKLTVSDAVEKQNAAIYDIKEDLKQHVLDISTRFYELDTSLSNKIEIIKNFVEQGSENIDKTLTTLYIIRDVINKSNENIDVSVENLKDVSVNLSAKLDNVSGFVDTVNSTREKLEDNVDALKTTRNDVADLVSKMDKKTDDVLNVVYSKVADLGTIKDELKTSATDLKKGIKNSADINVKLEDNMVLLDDLRSVQKRNEKSLKNTAKKVNKTVKDLKQNDKDLKKSLNSIKIIESEARKKELINKEVMNELKRFNIRLSKLDEAEFLFRIFTIKKQLKKYKKLPKWAAERRALLLKSVLLFEDEIADISIIYALLKGDASYTNLKRITGVRDHQLRSRLKRLIEEKRVKTYKKGRFTIYSIVV
jgi:chromosome segregation ATPase